MCVMTETIKLIADNFQKKDLPVIVNSMTEDERIDFVNSIRCLDVIADHITNQSIAA